MEGRLAGSRGGRRAARYIVDALAKSKLTPAAVQGYYQPFGDGYRNIVACCDGTVTGGTRRYVLLGAHYDHVGYGTRENSRGPLGEVHNGADDNASGTAAVLELARAFASHRPRSGASLLFAFWDAEESGMWGSAYWAEHPTVRLGSVAAVINLDMIGRLRAGNLTVYGSRSGYGLRRRLSMLNTADLYLDYCWDLENDADHYVFFQHRLPVLMFFTGEHDDYHSPRDDVDGINAAGLEQVSRLAYRLAASLAQSPPPRFRPQAERESELVRRLDSGTVTPAERPLNGVGSVQAVSYEAAARPAAEARPGRLGVTFRYDEAEPYSVTITSVLPGRPGALAGLRPQDRVYRVDGTDVAGERSFLKLLAKAGASAALLVERQGQTRAVDVALPQAAELIHGLR